MMRQIGTHFRVHWLLYMLVIGGILFSIGIKLQSDQENLQLSYQKSAQELQDLKAMKHANKLRLNQFRGQPQVYVSEVTHATKKVLALLNQPKDLIHAKQQYTHQAAQLRNYFELGSSYDWSNSFLSSYAGLDPQATIQLGTTRGDKLDVLVTDTKHDITLALIYDLGRHKFVAATEYQPVNEGDPDE